MAAISTNPLWVVGVYLAFCRLISAHHLRSSVWSVTRGQAERNDGRRTRGLPYVDRNRFLSEATPISNGTKTVVVQEFRPREYDLKVFKYVGVSGVDRTRIDQVGVSALDMKKR